MQSLINQGGWILVAILVSSFIGWLVVIYKWLVIHFEKKASVGWPESMLGSLEIKDLPAAIGVCHANPNILGRVLSKAIGSQRLRREMFEVQMARFVNGEISKLRSGLGLVSRIAAVSPLLGLLGTVAGLVQTFNVITVHGANDPALLAGGIEQALLTTQVGLVVSIPLLVLHCLLQSSVEDVELSAHLYIKKVQAILCGA